MAEIFVKYFDTFIILNERRKANLKICCHKMTFHRENVKINSSENTVKIVSFLTDMPGQTVQTQIRLLLEELSDQGLLCLQFPLHLLDVLL